MKPVFLSIKKTSDNSVPVGTCCFFQFSPPSEVFEINGPLSALLKPTIQPLFLSMNLTEYKSQIVSAFKAFQVTPPS